MLAPVALIAAEISHGPMLGRPGAETMSVWARTASPGSFQVRYGKDGKMDQVSEPVQTELDDDCTGIVTLTGLDPNTVYTYEVFNGESSALKGTFRTFPSSEGVRNDEFNPDGLFNFSFEFACGNNQNSSSSLGLPMRTYQTLLRDVKDEVHFGILNGDWLYEDKRDYPIGSWLKDVGIAENEQPKITEMAPSIAGLWENYKVYLERSPALREWHRHVPSFYTIDDHEIINDVYGCNTPSYRNRRPVYRDVAMKGWIDYLAWSNPMVHSQPAHIDFCNATKGSDIIEAPGGGLSSLPLEEMANLHVHWGGQLAGVKTPEPPIETADPNYGVYDIVEIIDDTHVRVDRPLVETRQSVFSIGRRSYGSFEIANCEFFILDTRTHRDLHDFDNPGRPDVSMLGKKQMDWLMDGLRESKADFRFLVSSVNFMIPHIGSGGGADKAGDVKKDDAWTVFLHDRERLIETADGTGKPTFILTGDLHNSYAIKVTDNVYEFASGPHNSINHAPEDDEGDRPANGKFQYGPRECDINWSSYAMTDMERLDRQFPHYCVVRVKNVFNQPQRAEGPDRWVAWSKPHVMFCFYNGFTGELAYVETIHLPE